ncbi:MAG: hypothetical protein ABWK00_00100 [Desulfurococcaceae archaeon]
MPTRRTRLFIYKTSMIPSTVDYDVIDVVTGTRIGSLDEEFVILELEQGGGLVLGGRPWKVIGIDSEKLRVYVEPASTAALMTIVPSWEGENIPVEHEIAAEVGRLIRLAREGQAPHEVDARVIDVLRGWTTPVDDRHVVISLIEPARLLVLSIFTGTRGNNLLKDIIKYVTSIRFPLAKIRASSTPYSIFISYDEGVDGEELVKVVVETIRGLNEWLKPERLGAAVKRSRTVLWRLYQVAQRFGAISPEAVRVSRALLEGFLDTVIGDEGLKEAFSRDYDVGALALIADAISRGEVKLEVEVREFAPEHVRELLLYNETAAAKYMVMGFDASSYLNKLLSRRVALLCVACGESFEGTVREFMEWEKFSCPRCGRASLAPVKPWDLDAAKELVRKARSGSKLTADERRELDELGRRATLLYRLGRTALLVLSAPGINLAEAVNILNRVGHGADVLREIYEGELRYVRSRSFKGLSR